MMIAVVYILISLILFYVAFAGLKALNIGIEAKKRNKFRGDTKKFKEKIRFNICF